MYLSNDLKHSYSLCILFVPRGHCVLRNKEKKMIDLCILHVQDA